MLKNGTYAEYALATVSTNNVFPKIFEKEEDAENFRQERPEPCHWKVVKRTVTYGEWK